MTNRDKVIKKLKDNYDSLEKHYVSDLEVLNHAGHGVTTGSYREEIWENMFRKIVPQKFAIARNSFIVDSMMTTSKEIDIIIYDQSYIPFIFEYGITSKLVPIEAVFAVVQCKSENTSNKKDSESIKKWVKSIDDLSTNPEEAIAASGLGGTLSNIDGDKIRKTRPIKIFCGLKDISGKNKNIFDLRIVIKNEKLEIMGKILEEKIKVVYSDLNTVEAQKTKENSLLDKTLTQLFGEVGNNLLKLHFIINQLIMLINNPMIFSYPSYADNFKEENIEK